MSMTGPRSAVIGDRIAITEGLDKKVEMHK